MLCYIPLLLKGDVYACVGGHSCGHRPPLAARRMHASAWPACAQTPHPTTATSTHPPQQTIQKHNKHTNNKQTGKQSNKTPVPLSHPGQLYDKRHLGSLTTASFWKTGVLLATAHGAVCFFFSYYRWALIFYYSRGWVATVMVGGCEGRGRGLFLLFPTTGGWALHGDGGGCGERGWGGVEGRRGTVSSCASTSGPATTHLLCCKHPCRCHPALPPATIHRHIRHATHPTQLHPTLNSSPALGPAPPAASLPATRTPSPTCTPWARSPLWRCWAPSRWRCALCARVCACVLGAGGVDGVDWRGDGCGGGIPIRMRARMLCCPSALGAPWGSATCTLPCGTCTPSSPPRPPTHLSRPPCPPGCRWR